MASTFQCLILNNFNPIAVRIEDESDILHPAVGEPFLPVDILGLEARTRCVKIIDRYTCFV